MKKKRLIIDIKNLNIIFTDDVYFMSLQSEIIALVINFDFILVIDAFKFFY